MKKIINTLIIAVFALNIAQAQNIEHSVLHKFNQIDISGGYLDVHISQSDEFKIEIEGKEEMMEDFEYAVKGGTLVVELPSDEKSQKRWFSKFEKETNLKVRIYSPNYERIKISGAANLYGEGLIKSRQLEIVASGATDSFLNVESDELYLSVSGASDLALNLVAESLDGSISGASDLNLKANVDYMKLRCSGASDVNAKGQANTIEIKASGASDYNGSNLISKMANVSSSGSADCLINSEFIRNLSVSGASDVDNYYRD